MLYKIILMGLLVVFSFVLHFTASSQIVSSRYLLGEWVTTDSSTGKKNSVNFNENHTVIFKGSWWNTTPKWIYKFELHDSIIDLTYKIFGQYATLGNEGILIVQDQNCFWWFNPNDYERYIKELQSGYNLAYKKEFDTWLRSVKDVCYRKKKIAGGQISN
jgi:hypothetical protein